jgi:hypothetical protein
MRNIALVDGGGGDSVHGGARQQALVRCAEPGRSPAAVVEIVEELHRTSSEAAAQGFPLMARRLDECGFALATGLANDRSNERELVERARRCLETWRALREW